MINRKKKVLMLVENYFPSDIRVRNEAETLIANGYAVSIIALKKRSQKSYEVFKGIHVYRIPELVLFRENISFSNSLISKAISQIRQVAKYGIEYIYFTAACFLISIKLFAKNSFDFIHLHNPPDTLFIIAVFFKLVGKHYIFDHHDLSPELFSVRFNKKSGVIKKLLIILEGFSCRLANRLICSNESYKNIDMIRHGISEDKIFVVRNNPNIEAFPKADYKRPANDVPTILYVGSINPQDGVDFLIDALEKLYYSLNMTNFKCDIVGDGDSLWKVTKLAKEKKISHKITFYGYIFERDIIYNLLAKADICVEPAPENELNLHSTFIKIMEYMSAGKPIVAFDLKENRFSAKNAAVFVNNEDTDGFALAMKKLLEDEEARKEMGVAGRSRIESELNWDAASKNLIKAYESLS